MLTGLVYAAILLLWAVVLVPHWLQRHDRRAEHRSAERFRRAMQSLKRHEVGDPEGSAARADGDAHRRTVSEYAGPRRVRVQGAAEAETGSQPVAVRADAAPAASSTRALAAQRRRRTALVLTISALLAASASIVGLVPAWVPIGVLLVLGTFLALGAWSVNRRKSTSGARNARPTSGQQASASAPGSSRAGRSREAGASTRGTDAPWSAVPPVVPTYVQIADQDRVAAGYGSALETDWTAQRMMEQAEALKGDKQDVLGEVGLDDYVDVRRPGRRSRSADDLVVPSSTGHQEAPGEGRDSRGDSDATTAVRRAG